MDTIDREVPLASPPTTEGDLAEWWSLVLRTTPRRLWKGTSSLIMLTAWWIWKHRNAAIFDNARTSIPSPLSTIKAEAQVWANAGARGLRQLLPKGRLRVELYGVV